MKASDAIVGPSSCEQEFLSETSAWKQEVAEKLAQKYDIWPLSEEHWQVIVFVRGYFLKCGQGPGAYRICKATGLSLQRICELFPCGMVRGAYRIAGLSRPSGCA